MPGDWIKVEKLTPNKLEIAALARKLNITQEGAFLQWFRLYCWADEITRDGSVPFLSRCEGDRLARCAPGTCDAMASEEIGWIRPIGDDPADWSRGFYFSNWFRHNGKCSKVRALDAEKKRKCRSDETEPSRFCPDDNGTKTGLEKRREDISTSTDVDVLGKHARRRAQFIKPTLAEVAEYCQARGKGVDPEAWYDHYEANGWKVGMAKTPMQNWKAAVRTWEKNQYGNATPTNSQGTAPASGRSRANQRSGRIRDGDYHDVDLWANEGTDSAPPEQDPGTEVVAPDSAHGKPN